jgi:hypothetical protein
MTLHCAICQREVQFVADPYDLPDGVGMAVEEGGEIYCSRCFIERRERATRERTAASASSAASSTASPTCRVCGKKLARGEVGMCYSCYVEQERSKFPQCGVCGALLPRTRGWRDPLAPWVTVTVGATNDHLDSRDVYWIDRGSAGRPQDVPLCLECAERYTPEEGWLWKWEKGRLYIISTVNWSRYEQPDIPTLQRAREEALRELQRQIEKFGELPPEG